MDPINEAYFKEAQNIDIQYTIKLIKDFNRKFNSKDPSDSDVKELTINAIKNLGFKTTKSNIEDLMDHLTTLLSIKNGKLPSSKSDIVEFYKFLGK